MDNFRLNTQDARIDHYNIKSGIDSITLMSCDYTSFFDTISYKKCIWKFYNVLMRTSVDSGSRFKLRFEPGVVPPEVVGGMKVKDTPFHLYPNVTIASMSLDVGVDLVINFYLSKPKRIQKQSYFSAAEMVVLCAAFNYARMMWPTIDAVDFVERSESEMRDIHRRTQQMHQFKGQVSAKSQEEYLKRTFVQMPSGYGRLFLTNVFKAMNLFATQIPTVVAELEELGINFYSEYFHGVKGVEISEDEYKEIAMHMYNTGFLVGKVAGCKNSFVYNPYCEVPTRYTSSGKTALCNKFMSKSFEYHESEMRKYFGHVGEEVVPESEEEEEDENVLADGGGGDGARGDGTNGGENERDDSSIDSDDEGDDDDDDESDIDAERQKFSGQFGSGDDDSMITGNGSVASGDGRRNRRGNVGRYENRMDTSDGEGDDEGSLVDMDVDDDGGNNEGRNDRRVITQEEDDAQVMEEDDGMDLEVETGGSKFRTKMKFKDGDLTYPRKLGKCIITYDVGFEIFSDDSRVSLVPKMSHAGYYLTSVLGGTRFLDEGGDWENNPENCDVYQRLKNMRGNPGYEDTLDMMLDDFRRRNQERIVNTWHERMENADVDNVERVDNDIDDDQEEEGGADWNKFWLSLITDHVVRHEGDVDGIFLNMSDALKEIRDKNMYTYPIFSNSTIYGCAHSGKTVMKVGRKNRSSEKLKMELDKGGPGKSRIFGGQVYSPHEYKLTMSKVIQSHYKLNKLGQLVRDMLMNDYLTASRQARIDTAKEFIEIMNWYSNFEQRQFTEMQLATNGSTRIEFFMCYDERNTYDDRFDKLPDVMSTFQAKKSQELFEMVIVGLQECSSPLMKLKTMLEEAIDDDRVPNTNRICKEFRVCYVLIAELFLLRMNRPLFNPYYLKRLIDDVGSFSIGGLYKIPRLARFTEASTEDESLKQKIRDNIAITGLNYGIKLDCIRKIVYYMNRIENGAFFSKDHRDQTLNYLSNVMKKVVRLSLHYVTALHKLKCLLQSFTRKVQRGGEWRFDNVTDNVIEFTCFDEVDLDVIAAIEDFKKIELLLDEIGILMANLYQEHWFYMVSSRKARMIHTGSDDGNPVIFGSDLNLDNFPKTTRDLIDIQVDLIDSDENVVFDQARDQVDTISK